MLLDIALDRGLKIIVFTVPFKLHTLLGKNNRLPGDQQGHYLQEAGEVSRIWLNYMSSQKSMRNNFKMSRSRMMIERRGKSNNKSILNLLGVIKDG